MSSMAFLLLDCEETIEREQCVSAHCEFAANAAIQRAAVLQAVVMQLLRERQMHVCHRPPVRDSELLRALKKAELRVTQLEKIVEEKDLHGPLRHEANQHLAHAVKPQYGTWNTHIILK